MVPLIGLAQAGSKGYFDDAGFPAGNDPGTPAFPDTGSLVSVNGNGTFTTVASALDRPTSMEIIQNSAYVTTLDGDIYVIENVASAPFGG